MVRDKYIKVQKPRNAAGIFVPGGVDSNPRSDLQKTALPTLPTLTKPGVLRVSAGQGSGAYPDQGGFGQGCRSSGALSIGHVGARPVALLKSARA